MAAEVVGLYKLLTDRTSAPVALVRAMVDRFGAEWLSWPFSVIRRTLEKELRGPIAAVATRDAASPEEDDTSGVPEWAMHRVCALAAVALQDAFWEHWEHFHFLTQALNGDVADFRNHKPLTIGQMMLAVYSAEQVRHDLGSLSHVPPFSEEVARYVAAQALGQGVWYLPPPLDFAEKYAAGRRYRCKDCGNDSEVLFDDGLCDVCTHRFDTSSLGAWKPDPELVAKGWGHHIEIYEKNPVAAVAKRLRAVVGHPDRTLQENATDVCVARILAAAQYAGYPLAERLAA